MTIPIMKYALKTKLVLIFAILTFHFSGIAQNNHQLKDNRINVENFKDSLKYLYNCFSNGTWENVSCMLLYVRIGNTEIPPEYKENIDSFVNHLDSCAFSEIDNFKIDSVLRQLLKMTLTYGMSYYSPKYDIYFGLRNNLNSYYVLFKSESD